MSGAKKFQNGVRYEHASEPTCKIYHVHKRMEWWNEYSYIDSCEILRSRPDSGIQNILLKWKVIPLAVITVNAHHVEVWPRAGQGAAVWSKCIEVVVGNQAFEWIPNHIDVGRGWFIVTEGITSNTGGAIKMSKHVIEVLPSGQSLSILCISKSPTVTKFGQI